MNPSALYNHTGIFKNIREVHRETRNAAEIFLHPLHSQVLTNFFNHNRTWNAYKKLHTLKTRN